MSARPTDPVDDVTNVGGTRRDFLRRAGLTGAAVAAATAAGARPAAAADVLLGEFPYGVASGDPLPTRVILWTRVVPPVGGGDVPVTWRVARDVTMTDIVATGTVTASSAKDWTVKVDPTGLSPATYYFYDFASPGSRSITGRTRTAPAGVTNGSLRFGVVSCSNYTGGFFNAYANLAKRNDIEAVLHLGDYLYEYGNTSGRYGPSEAGDTTLVDQRMHAPATEMTTLSDYRLRHGTYKLDPDLRRLHQLFPFITVWDDHESTNNSRLRSAQNHSGSEGTDGTWATRRRESQQAYAEWMPTRTVSDDVIYRTFRYGDLLDLIMLDTRLEGRDDEIGTTLNTVSTAAIDDPARRLISQTQQDFLKAALDAPGATWKVIGQQVIMGQWNLGSVPTLPGADMPQFVLREDGNAINPDQWDGYTADRGRVFAHVRGPVLPTQLATPPPLRVPNVVVLTGDVHTSWALDLHENPKGTTEVPPYEMVTGRNALGVEFVTPSVTSANFESLGEAGVQAFEASAMSPVDNPHVKYVDFASHGYFVLDVSRARVQADWYYVDTVLRPSDVERFGAAWRVLNGVSHLDQTAGVSNAAQAPSGDASAPRPAPLADGTPPPVVPEVPSALLVPLGAAAVVAGAVAFRRRREGQVDPA